MGYYVEYKEEGTEAWVKVRCECKYFLNFMLLAAVPIYGKHLQLLLVTLHFKNK